MDSLNNSSFFDGRTIEFTRKLINSTGKVSHLSASEKELIDRRDELIELNKDLDYSLITKLSEYKNWTPVMDCIFFLLQAREQNILERADYILQMAVREEQVLTAKELSESLLEIDDMPAGWIVNLLGLDSGNRHPKVSRAQPVSSLNLEAMKNFK